MNIIVISQLSKLGNFVVGNTIKASGTGQLTDSGQSDNWNKISVRIAIGA